MYLFVLYCICLFIYLTLFLYSCLMYQCMLYMMSTTPSSDTLPEISLRTTPRNGGFFFGSIQIYTQILVNHFQHNNWQRSAIRIKTKRKKTMIRMFVRGVAVCPG